jgi:hypothetical protein
MPLRMKWEGGLYRPVIVCDHCGLEISDAEDGNYEWQVEQSGAIVDGTIYFTHKRCCHPFEQANGGRPAWFAITLECLPVFLANNLQVDWHRAEKTARLMATLGSEEQVGEETT